MATYNMDAWKTVPAPTLKHIRSDFKSYCIYMHEALTGTRMAWEPFHDDIANMFIDMYKGECLRGIINIPPRSGKTYMACLFMSWSLGNAPWSEFMYACYSNRLATKATSDVKNFMQHPCFKRLFPAVKLASDTKAKDFFRTTRGGVVYATSTGGTATGFGAGKAQLPDGETFGGVLIVDDLLKASDARSKTERLNANEWYEETYENRKNNLAMTPTLIIAQRLNEDDVVGLVLRRKTQTWKQLCVPAIYEDDTGEECSFWETKFPVHLLQDDRTNNPSYFSTQFQQDPIDKEGAIIKVENFRRFDLWNPPTIQYAWIFADTALTKNERSDPSCFELWGYAKGSIFLLDAWHKKADTTELEREAIAFWRKCKLRDVGLRCMAIEAKASGHQLIQSLPSKGVTVKQVNRPNDKISRANGAQPWVDKGHVYIPMEGQLTILPEFIAEAKSFPNYKHDDTLEGLFDACQYLLGVKDPFEGVNAERFNIPTRDDADLQQFNYAAFMPATPTKSASRWSTLST